MEDNKALATTDNNKAQVFGDNSKPFYCSKSTETIEDKKALFNALENCDLLLNNCVGEQIAIKDIYIERYMKKDDEKPHFRSILFAEDGKTYVSTSYGIVNVLQKIMAIYGEPATWKEPVKVEVGKRPVGDGKQLLTLKLI